MKCHRQREKEIDHAFVKLILPFISDWRTRRLFFYTLKVVYRQPLFRPLLNTHRLLVFLTEVATTTTTTPTVQTGNHCFHVMTTAPFFLSSPSHIVLVLFLLVTSETRFNQGKYQT